MKSKLLFTLLFIISCTSHSNLLENYKPEKQDTDKSIFPKSWFAKDTILLEENITTVIQNISSASVSNDSKHLVIAVPNLRSLLLYDYKTGKILNKFRTDTRLSDIYATSGRTPHNLSHHLEQFKDAGLENLIFIPKIRWEEYGFSLNDTLSLFINNFCEVKYYNKYIFASALIRARAVNSED